MPQAIINTKGKGTITQLNTFQIQKYLNITMLSYVKIDYLAWHCTYKPYKKM